MISSRYYAMGKTGEMMKSNSYIFFGSAPLCAQFTGGPPEKIGEPFVGLLERVREHLESFPNVRILELEAGAHDFSVRFPTVWQPVDDDDLLEPDRWAFAEYFSPLLFTFHLPSKLQESMFPSHGKRSGIEDFVIAYDGMIFAGVAESQSPFAQGSIAPMVRKYIVGDLLKSLGDLVVGVIPPSPMHLDINVVLFEGKESDRLDAEEITYDPSYSNITILRSHQREPNAKELLKTIFSELRREVQLFYHTRINVRDVQDKQGNILNGLRSVYSNYKGTLSMPRWHYFRKLNIAREISGDIGGIHQAFCEHSLSVVELEEARQMLIREVSVNRLLKYAKEYFIEMTKPVEFHYSVFLDSIDHIRSHLLALEQNRNVLYAALVGSFIALLSTLVGYLLSRLGS